MERFPPAKWGGSYEHSLLLPICRRCNTTHGRMLADSQGEKSPKNELPIEIKFDGEVADLVDFLLKVMVSNSIEYAVAMNEGHIKKAKEAALRNFDVWSALKGAGAGVRIVDKGTGEVVGVAETPYGGDLLDFLDSLNGIPELLAPLKASKSKGKKK